MSIEAMNWAWSVPGLAPVERLLLLGVADHADERWSSYPGQESLAERACVSERTVRSWLASMEEKGLFRRERRYSNGARSSDRFYLNQAYRQELPVEGYRQNEATLPANNGDLTGNLLPGNRNNPNNHQFMSEAAVAAPRADVEALFFALEEGMMQNCVKVAERSKKNLDAARLLLDADKRDLDEALEVLRWSQRDEFWRSNILSMSKFRAQFDKLRLQMGRGAGVRSSAIEQGRAVDALLQGDLSAAGFFGELQ